MTIKKQYLYFFFAIVGLLAITLLIVQITKPQKSKSLFLNTIPLFNKKITPTPSPKTVFTATQTPQQTNLTALKNNFNSNLSLVERDKISQVLPVRINNFQTSTSLITTINLFTLASDPPESLRLEIYGVNYNNSTLTSDDAIAFKDSFLQIKKAILSRKINYKNLLLIYGNRQYIQDTATFWVKEFKLLD